MQAVLALAIDRLKQEPVHSGVAPDSTFSCAAQGGSGAGAAVQAFRGAGVQWCAWLAGLANCRGLGLGLACMLQCHVRIARRDWRHLSLRSSCASCRLSSSALADPQHGFGTCRLLGFVLATCRGTDAACRDSDVPHLALDQTLLGDKVGGQGLLPCSARHGSSI